MTIVTTRLSDDEISYLNKLASSKNFYNSHKKPSLGKIFKSLLQWCMENDLDFSSQNKKQDNQSKKLLEQIHVAIPHILYLLRLDLLMHSHAVSDDAVAVAKLKSIEYINGACGDFQNIEYSEIEKVYNEIGLVGLPVEKGKTKWMIKKK